LEVGSNIPKPEDKNLIDGEAQDEENYQ